MGANLGARDSKIGLPLGVGRIAGGEGFTNGEALAEGGEGARPVALGGQVVADLVVADRQASRAGGETQNPVSRSSTAAPWRKYGQAGACQLPRMTTWPRQDWPESEPRGLSTVSVTR